MNAVELLWPIVLLGTPPAYVYGGIRLVRRRGLPMTNDHPWKVPSGELVLLGSALVGWLVVLMVSATAAYASEWEGWEPKTTLPTQALETLDAQAVTLAPPVEVVDDVERWRPLVADHFVEVDAALDVMRCESGGNPDARNRRSTAAGLFQFIRSTWDWVAGILGLETYSTGAVYDPAANVAAAGWLSAGGTDWTHWECKP